MDVGPGDFVQCVATAGAWMADPQGLAQAIGDARIEAGRIYTVQEARDTVVNEAFYSFRSPNIVLTAPDTHWIAWDGKLGGWCLGFFRPVRKPPIPAETLALQRHVPLEIVGADL